MIKKVVSWNVNGIRAIYKKGFIDILQKMDADLFAIQETKANKDQLSEELLRPKGYKSIWYSAKKLGYSGLGVYYKENLKFDVDYGLSIDDFDSEGRTMSMFFDDFIFVNAYFPNSQGEGKRLNFKIEYCDAMLEYLNKFRNKKVLLSGDYNIAHTQIDLANPKDNEQSPGYFPEERSWMSKFLDNGYVDTFRMFNTKKDNYTWWSYRTRARDRNVGWRIDYHCVNENLKNDVKSSVHNNDIFGSDHCPVTITFK